MEDADRKDVAAARDNLLRYFVNLRDIKVGEVFEMRLKVKCSKYWPNFVAYNLPEVPNPNSKVPGHKKGKMREPQDFYVDIEPVVDVLSHPG